MHSQTKESLSNGLSEVLAKHPLYEKNGEWTFNVNERLIGLVGTSQCQGAEFTLYPESIGQKLDGYAMVRNPNPQAITLQINSSTLSYEVRQALAAWVQMAFQRLPPSTGIVGVKSFFQEMEPGYQASMSWNSPMHLDLLKGTNFKLGVELPIFRKTLAEAAEKDGIKVQLFDFPLKDGSIHGQLLSSGIHAGRHIILQDLLKWNFALGFLQQAPKTRKALEVIAQRSASTVPPDQITLQEFETSARAEMALVPVGRRYVIAFSSKSVPLQLNWTESGELNFIERKSAQK
jgi:hypothetical protein